MQTESEKRTVRLFFGGLAIIAVVINGTVESIASRLTQPIAIPQVARLQSFEAQPARQTTTLNMSPAQLSTERAAQEQAAQRANYIARYVNPGLVRAPGTEMVALAIVSEDGKYDRTLNAAIGSRLQAPPVQILSSVFRPAFVADGLFSQALSGSTSVIDKLELSKSVDMLLLGRETVEYSTDPSLGNLVSAHLHLELTAVSVSSAQSRSWSFLANGAGFKQTEARQMAEERLIKQIAKDTRISLNL